MIRIRGSAPALLLALAAVHSRALAITVYGGDGPIGRHIVDEALARGHRLTVVAPHAPAGAALRGRLAYARGDILDGAGIARQLAGQDSVVDATSSGAGSLQVAPGRTVIDTMPMLAHGEPLGQKLSLDYYRTVTDLAWSFLSPSLQITPGTRTGRLRVGADDLLRDAAGNSRIFTEDFAVAVVDEIERPAHRHQRFTVGY